MFPLGKRVFRFPLNIDINGVVVCMTHEFLMSIWIIMDEQELRKKMGNTKWNVFCSKDVKVILNSQVGRNSI